VERTEAGGRVRARVLRNGREVVRAAAVVGGPPVTSVNFLPIILYEEIPRFDGQGCDAARFATTTSRFTNLARRAGTGNNASSW
jgi:hypothetical protein